MSAMMLVNIDSATTDDEIRDFLGALRAAGVRRNHPRARATARARP
ncbi:hypothetical protein [Cupriavidus sp. H39]